MANLALTNCTIWVHDTDMSAYLNKVTLRPSVAELPADTFGTAATGWRARLGGGLKTVAMTEDGFWSAPAPDASDFASLGVGDRAVTVSAQGTEGSIAYLLQAGRFGYDQFGKIGDLVPFSMSAANTNKVGLVRGQLASISRTISGTGQIGSILTLAGPLSTQFLYATLHVFTAATTLTVIVESAPTVGFAAPVTRATIGPITVAGGTFMARVAGAITDGFWRLNATTCTGSFVVAGAIGVGS
jgi:hypothetical protein